MPLNRPPLLVLSDLWGGPAPAWLTPYQQRLQAHFDWQYLDSCRLAKLPEGARSQQARHRHFVEGGIVEAAQALCQTYPQSLSILAFSVGGVIAWEAVQRGLKVQKYQAISATRLRYQTNPSSVPLRLVYGTADPYRPKRNWLQSIPSSYLLLPAADHDCYSATATRSSLAEDVANFLLPAS